MALHLPRLQPHWSRLQHPGESNARPIDHAALEENRFRKALWVERKRSERSHKTLLLVLMDGTSLFAANGTDSIRSRVVTALLHSTRESDVLGWHRQDSVLAALFTESGPAASASAIRGRIGEILRDVLPPEELDRIVVSVYAFPAPEPSSGPPNPIFYPEIDTHRKPASILLKRALDVVGSLLALFLSWPLWLVIAILVKLTSPGPVFFRQTRVGQYGHPFTFLKFRSMYVGCDSRIHEEYISRLITGAPDAKVADGNGNHVYKITDDPRVTPLGRFLRRTSLDELPQLLNVLGGDMSLVGPRPPLPYEVNRYELWHHRRVISVKPGITGLWQVSGRNRTTFDEMVRLDLRYVDTASLALDLQILLQTPRAILLGTGY